MKKKTRYTENRAIECAHFHVHVHVVFSILYFAFILFSLIAFNRFSTMENGNPLSFRSLWKILVVEEKPLCTSLHVFTYICKYMQYVQSIYGTYTCIQFPLVNSQNPRSNFGTTEVQNFHKILDRLPISHLLTGGSQQNWEVSKQN